mgnify:CR=1 FL=1
MKNFKEYLGISTIRVSGLDSIRPIASLGDTPPKGQGRRVAGLQAGKQSPVKNKILKKEYAGGMTGPGIGTYKPISNLSADTKIKKKIKESALFKHMVDKKIIKDK